MVTHLLVFREQHDGPQLLLHTILHIDHVDMRSGTARFVLVYGSTSNHLYDLF